MKPWWPHCDDPVRCYMHLSAWPTRWCGCRCIRCRIAHAIRWDLNCRNLWQRPTSPPKKNRR